MQKLRILHPTEFTGINTGYSNYSREILTRLNATNKYEILELASYVLPTDPRLQQSPWPVVACMPHPNDKTYSKTYQENQFAQFGSELFEEVCIKFHPDVVLTVRDPWMDSFVETSPFRRLYNWACMTTVDAEPQADGWISSFSSADGVFGYTDWGLEVLKKQGLKNTVSAVPPGADYNIFCPQDKIKVKKELGLPEDSIIIGMVARNQKRKLYPNLLESFRDYLNSANPDLSKKVYLYLHTSWPDAGWDIPFHIKDNGLGTKVFVSYICRNCKYTFSSLYQDSRAACPRGCGLSCTLPSTHHGFSREQLAKTMSSFDIYVQLAACEGFGMPLIEASACGVPVMAVDYSGMSDIISKIKGEGIRVSQFVIETETGRKMAIPDKLDFVKKLTKLVRLPNSARMTLGFQQRELAIQNYNYDKSSEKWMDYLDKINKSNWRVPPFLHQAQLHDYQNMTNEDFVNTNLVSIAGRPDLVNSYTSIKMVRDLNAECKIPIGGGFYTEMAALGAQQRFIPYSKEDVKNELLAICNKNNYWESERVK